MEEHFCHPTTRVIVEEVGVKEEEEEGGTSGASTIPKGVWGSWVVRSMVMMEE